MEPVSNSKLPFPLLNKTFLFPVESDVPPVTKTLILSIISPARSLKAITFLPLSLVNEILLKSAFASSAMFLACSSIRVFNSETVILVTGVYKSLDSDAQ